jgi:hypothetical protein
MKVVGMRTFDLIVSEDATGLFLWYGLDQLHGLSLFDAKIAIAQGDKYIHGMANYHPQDFKLDFSKRPYIFLNGGYLSTIPLYEVATIIMHEAMHLSIILNGGLCDDNEEDVIEQAEQIANDIMEVLRFPKDNIDVH